MMKRLLAGLLLIAMLMTILLSCAKDPNESKESGNGKSNIDIAENVIAYSEQQMPEIEESIVSKENSKDETILTVKKDSPIASMKVDDIFMLPADKDSVFGNVYFGKVTAVNEIDGNISYSVVTPMMDEIFSELNLNFDEPSGFDDIYGVETFDGVKVECIDDPKQLYTDASATLSSSADAVPSLDVGAAVYGNEIKITYDIDLKKYLKGSSNPADDFVYKVSVEESKTTEVFYTDTGLCYHRESCRYLCKSKHPTTVYDAVHIDELRPCKICQPPVPKFNDNDWYATNSKLQLHGVASIYDMSVQIVSENGSTWSFDDGFDNMAVRTTGSIFANATLDGSFEMTLGDGSVTNDALIEDWLYLEGLKEKAFPLAFIKYSGGNVDFRIGESSYENPALITVGLLIYADINGKISATTTMYCEYSNDISFDMDIFRDGKFLGIGAESQKTQSLSAGNFDWKIDAEMQADVDFEILGCSALLFIGNVNIMELSLINMGIYANGDLIFSASPKEQSLVANGKIRCYIKAIAFDFRLKAYSKYGILDEHIDKNVDYIIDKTLWEKKGNFTFTSLTIKPPENAYSSTEGLIFELNEDKKGYTVTGVGTCTATDIIIDTHNGLPVTRIENRAFMDCKTIKNLTIGNNVTSIGVAAFEYCDRLEKVTVGNEIKRIGDMAFAKCENLKDVTIGSSVTKIGFMAFFGCPKISSITIPNSVTTIDSYAFDECTSLSTIKFKGNNDQWADIYKGLDWVSDSVTIEILYGCAHTSGTQEWIKTATTHKKVYSCCGKVTVAEKAHDFSDGMCSECRYSIYSQGLEFDLDSFTDTYTVKGIGTCTDAELMIPTTYNGKEVTRIGEFAFDSCINLTSVTIPNTITIIDQYAFSMCTNLLKVNISDGITTIDFGVFQNCYALESVTIPASVTSIGVFAFSHCDNLTSIAVDEDNTAYKSIDGNLYTKDGKNLIRYAIGKTATSFTVPNNVTNIEKHAFAGCDNLTSVTISASVTNISPSAFSDCRSLTSIVVNEDNTAYKSIDGNLYTKDGKNLIQYAIGKTATSFTVPNNVTNIKDYAFYGCYNLTSVTIPSGVTRIGEVAFCDCNSLTSVTIPNSVVFIGTSAFAGCHSLANIMIPSSVTSIGFFAFSRCDNLTSIAVDEDNTAYKSIDGNLYTKDGKNLIRYAIGKTATSFTVPNNVTNIEDYAFYGCNNLTSVTIPSNVTSISANSFAFCNNLTSVAFENTSGWWYSPSPSATNGTSILSAKLENPATAATYLKSTYCNYYWKCN